MITLRRHRPAPRARPMWTQRGRPSRYVALLVTLLLGGSLTTLLTVAPASAQTGFTAGVTPGAAASPAGLVKLFYRGPVSLTASVHGLSYDPRTGRWSALAGSPLRGRIGAMAQWTGTEMVIWGGSSVSGASVAFTDGAAYTPGTP